MLRAVVLFLVGLLVGACTQAAVVPLGPNLSVQALESQTVALTRVREDGTTKAFCTGVWVSQSTILTAAHCLRESELGFVVREDIFHPGEFVAQQSPPRRKAQAYVIDDRHDLALLRALAPIPTHGIARVRLDAIAPGARVATMGHPLGLWWSYSSGDIASIRYLPIEPALIYVQTTAPTNPGNSGGGLFDQDGFLIGIAHAGILNASNLAFYVHGYYVQALLESQAGVL